MSGARLSLLPAEGNDAPSNRVLDGIRHATGRVLNLHRALGHSPVLLQAFADLALTLRNQSATSRTLREFVIVHIAQLSHSDYELVQHLPMARTCGITDEQLNALADWRLNPALFDAEVSAALAYTEELFFNRVTDATFEQLRQHFHEAQVVELTLTASFYVMVALTAGALALPAEDALPSP